MDFQHSLSLIAPEIVLSLSGLALLLAAAVLWMGVYPESFLAPMRADIQALDARVARARPQGDARLAMSKAEPAEAAAHEGAH